MKDPMRHHSKKGFTLIELLVAIAVLLILLAIVLVMVNRSRARAEDAKTMETLASVRTLATEDKLQSDSFAPTFGEPSGRSYQALQQLATDHGFAADEYAYHASANEFVIVFPLKANDGYWCVDSAGVSKFVVGFPAGTPPYVCDNIDDGDDDDEEVATLNGTTSFLGTRAASYVEPATLRLYDASTLALVGTYGVSINGSGNSGQFSIDVPAGTYHVALKGADTLQRVTHNQTLSEGSHAVSFATLTEGDANGDSIVNDADLAIVGAAYNTGVTYPHNPSVLNEWAAPDGTHWNPAADLNEDNFVTAIDLSLLVNGYGQSDEQP